MGFDRHMMSMRNSEASVRMEGYEITPQLRKQCEQVLRGELSTEECLKRFAADQSKGEK